MDPIEPQRPVLPGSTDSMFGRAVRGLRAHQQQSCAPGARLQK